MMTPNKLKYCFIVSLIIYFSVPAFSQSNSAKAEEELQKIMKDLDVVGLSVAVVKKGKTIYTHSFGLKNIEKSEALADRDIFRIASISKSFSATAVMQLVEAGKISLDDDFSNLVGFTLRNPKFPRTIITLRMLMSHTSSLNDSKGYFSLDVLNPEKNPDWEKCYNDYEPGKGYKYCNLNYNLIGAMIEKNSGERFDQYIKHHILDRLKLYGGYEVDALDSNRFVTLYERDSASKQFNASRAAYAPRTEEIKNYVAGYSTPVFSPTGGMKISAGDLAKYMTMHMNFGNCNGVKIISEKSARLMQTEISADEHYGLALLTKYDLIPDKVMKGHTGVAYGLYSAMFFQPEEKFGIVVITNGCNATYTNDTNDVVRLAINSLYNNFIK